MQTVVCVLRNCVGDAICVGVPQVGSDLARRWVVGPVNASERGAGPPKL
jgi:hypothetical protein